MESPLVSRLRALILAAILSALAHASAIRRPLSTPSSAATTKTATAAAAAALAAIPWPRLAAYARHALCFLGFVLAPSFLRPWFLSPAPSPPSPTTQPSQRRQPPSPTAYLDGLRGVAACIVCVYHFLYFGFPRAKAGYSTKPTDPDDHHLWAQLPFVHTLHSGRGSVAVFFVISGFVLSLRALTLARRRRFDAALESLAQSTFRRPFRIFLPIIAVTLVSVVLLRWENVFYVDSPYNFSVPPRENSTMAQLEGWAYNMTALADHVRFMPAGRHMYKPPYDIFLWTIPIEMKGSLYIFVLLLAFLRARAVVRVGVVGALMLYLGRTTDLDMSLFLAGMLLAEASIYLAAGDKDAKARRTLSDILAQLAVYAMFLIGFWMLGYPDEEGEKAYGFMRLHKLAPAAYNDNGFIRQFFWHGFGAILLVAALVLCPMPAVSRASSTRHKSEYELLPTSSPIDSPPSPADDADADDKNNTNHPPTSTEPLLRRPFTTPLAQYLGRISFALYLVQGIVIKTLSAQRTIAARTAFAATEALAKAALAGTDDPTAKPIAMAATAAAAILRKADHDALMADAWRAYHWDMVKNATLSTVVLFWASDLFWMYVDRHAAAVGRAVARWCWVPGE